jgi:hypothetical protein
MKVEDFFKSDSGWKTIINVTLVEKSREYELLEDFNGMDEDMDFT